MPTRPELDDARRRLQKALNDAGTDEVMRKIAEAALGIKQRVRHTFDCKYCNRNQSQWVEISDPVGAATAFQKLADQANGRPKEAENESGITVNYRVVIVGAPDPDDEIAAN